MKTYFSPWSFDRCDRFQPPDANNTDDTQLSIGYRGEYDPVQNAYMFKNVQYDSLAVPFYVELADHDIDFPVGGPNKYNYYAHTNQYVVLRGHPMRDWEQKCLPRESFDYYAIQFSQQGVNVWYSLHNMIILQFAQSFYVGLDDFISSDMYQDLMAAVNTAFQNAFFVDADGTRRYVNDILILGFVRDNQVFFPITPCVSS